MINMSERDPSVVAVAQKLQELIRQAPASADMPLFGFADEDEEQRSYSPRQLLVEVENNSAVGRAFVENWVKLFIDHLNKSPLTRTAASKS
jgi:hypothetical protein